MRCRSEFERVLSFCTQVQEPWKGRFEGLGAFIYPNSNIVYHNTTQYQWAGDYERWYGLLKSSNGDLRKKAKIHFLENKNNCIHINLKFSFEIKDQTAWVNSFLLYNANDILLASRNLEHDKLIDLPKGAIIKLHFETKRGF